MLQATITILDDGTVKYDENITGHCLVSHFGMLYQAMITHGAEMIALCAANITKNNMPYQLCQNDLLIGMQMYMNTRKAKFDEQMAQVQANMKAQVPENATADPTPIQPAEVVQTVEPKPADVLTKESSGKSGGKRKLPAKK